jgi:hypothetical protein
MFWEETGDEVEITKYVKVTATKKYQTWNWGLGFKI